MPEIQRYKALQSDAGRRLDVVLAGALGLSRSRVSELCKSGQVSLESGRTVKASWSVSAGETFSLPQLAPVLSGQTAAPEDIPLSVVYEDSHLLVIDKPAGMVVHPGSGNPNGTLVNGVAHHLKQQDPNLDESALPRFGLVHRIDKNTSGLLVMAKTPKAMTSLAKQFFNHTVHRRYIALVWGDVEEDAGTIVAHVGRHQRFRKLFTAYPDGEYGKDAITHYKVLERLNYVTLIECRLETGRTHQIRVHMQLIGHPLFNDDFYGGDRIVKGTIFSKYKQFVENCFALCPRHALHAKELGFTHPGNNRPVHFETALPADMEAVIDKWRNYIGHKGHE